jgi:hypothetical protein
MAPRTRTRARMPGSSQAGIRTAIRGGIGHNLPQEAPEAFAVAVVDVDGYPPTRELTRAYTGATGDPVRDRKPTVGATGGSMCTIESQLTRHDSVAARPEGQSGAGL